jgi:hypothetical protein
MKKLEKPFNPKDYESYEDLPEAKKSEFKSADEKSESFVRKSAIENPEEAHEEAERIVLAKVLEFKYEPGHFIPADVDRNKYGQPRGPVYSMPEIRGAECDMTVELEGGIKETIWMRNDLRLVLGIKRFTSEIIDLLYKTMPETVSVEELRDGSFQVSPDDLIEWAGRVRERRYKKKAPEYKEEMEQEEREYQEELSRREEQRKEEMSLREEEMKSWLTRKSLIKSAQGMGLFVGDVNKKIANVSLRHPEWVGQTVNKGGQLFTVYSPELLQAVEEELNEK